MQPEPLPLEQPARLARPVQLQAVRKATKIPGLPAFCGSQGGVVRLCMLLPPAATLRRHGEAALATVKRAVHRTSTTCLSQSRRTPL